MYRLILASRSPRRLELLKKAGFLVAAVPIKVSETLDKNLNLNSALQDLATRKSRAFVQAHNSLKGQKILVVSGDTVVEHRGEVLGKPASRADAIATLKKLSGHTHRVLTALSLVALDDGRAVECLDQTSVEFRDLQQNEIEAYVDTGEPMDKAGSYAIQGGAKKFVTKTVGSWSNVVGLPLELFERTLTEHGWDVERESHQN